MSNDLKVALIGCGRMGSLWDEGAVSSAPPITHASAVLKTPGVELAALCDSDPVRLAEALRVRGAKKTFTSLAGLLDDFTPDIAILSTPTSVRLAEIEKLVSAGCKTIVCEKPLASSVAEAGEIVALVKASGAKLLVNYLRRWAPEFAKLRESLSRGKLGEVQRVAGFYGKGISNNASHQIDLVSWLVGPAQMVRSLGVRADEGEPFGGSDTSIDAELLLRETSGGKRDIPFTLLATDHRAYSIFEFEIFATDARIRVVDSGRTIEIYRVGTDSQYKGYRRLAFDSKVDSGLDLALVNMIREATELSRGTRSEPTCSLSDGLAVVSAVEAIRTSEARGGLWVNV